MCYMCWIRLQDSSPQFSHQSVVCGSNRKMPGCSADNTATCCQTSTAWAREGPIVRDTERVVTDELSITQS